MKNEEFSETNVPFNDTTINAWVADFDLVYALSSINDLFLIGPLLKNYRKKY